MGQRLSSPRGFILLEALVAVFIFAFGILGLVGMYAMSIKDSTEARFRNDAAFLADSLIAQLQLADAATRATSYASPGGASFTSWRDTRVYPLLPGAQVSGAAPTVVFDATNPNQVTVTLKWQAKNDSAIRQYVVTSILDAQ